LEGFYGLEAATYFKTARSALMRIASSLVHISCASAAVLSGMAFSLLPGAAVALECPVSHSQSGKGVLQETPQAIAAMSKVLAANAAGAAPDIVAGLKQRHPNASNGEIINYLVTAYCPVVNRQRGQSEATKRAQMAHFNKSIVNTVYR
jgi:hypothetical protein